MSKPKINVLDFLPFGIKNALSMSELAKRMGIDQRTARKMVFEARRSGAVICSTCSENAHGYYRPNNAAEVRPYISMQLSQIRSAQKALKSAQGLIAAEAGEKNG